MSLSCLLVSHTLAMLDADLAAERSKSPYGSIEEARSDPARPRLSRLCCAVSEAHSLPDVGNSRCCSRKSWGH
jgi:hypothetical protein